MTLKISIITPTFNAEKYLEDTIKSVQMQEYTNVEHIVVDGGSTDSTIEILKKYSHLKWVSEKDNGQSDAMNKGFALSSGDIIGYLNADDYYNPNVFNTIIRYFNKGAFFVQGKIKVEREDKSFTINNAQTTFQGLIRHWEPNAFCVNPVGYFYRREVQQKVGGFDVNNHFSMDLQFLIGIAKLYSITKINEDIILGVFRYYEQTKTSKDQSKSDLWCPKTFWYIDEFIKYLPEEEKQQYYKEREQGYEMRKKWQAMEKNSRKNLLEKAKYLLKKNKIIL
ncbi:MAG: glycosyltransferase [Bacteroidales bacterium]|nr:glycosyltransferase [Bacteroidales bacterium]